MNNASSRHALRHMWRRGSNASRDDSKNRSSSVSSEMREPFCVSDASQYGSNRDYAELGGSDVEACGPAGAGGTPGGLGMWEGVFVPCCLCIFGVILYQRLGWIVGQAGVRMFLLMLFVSYAVVIVTALSLSALSTNGRLRGGGAYYLVSRALGPELGGAIGAIFYAANISGCVVYLLGFAAEFCDLVYGEGAYGRWTRTGFGIVGLVGVTIICYVGPQLYAKTAVTAFALTVVVLTTTLISLLSQRSGAAQGYTGVKSTTFQDNLGSSYTDGYDFASIFAILFPAVTGIMAGANMSGLLKRPSKSIPKGTLLATGGSSLVYLAFALAIAASNSADTLTTVKGYSVLRRTSVFPPCVSAGVFCAVLMSTMGTEIGAAQILLALANDRLLPGLGVFRGDDDGGAPSESHTRRAVVVTFVLIGLVILSGADLNAMATFQTLFFLLSYAIINLACFVLSIQGSVNFRPVWRYYSWHTSLIGFAACVGVMFFVHPLRAALCLVICMALVLYLLWAGPDSAAAWGDVTQSLIFHHVRKYLLRLDEQRQHVKFWRPHVLLLTGSPRGQYSLIHLANNLKKGGVLFLGDVVSGGAGGGGGGLSSAAAAGVGERRRAWLDLAKECKLKAFPCVTTAATLREGVAHMLFMAGMGAIKPNSVLLPFPEAENGSGGDELLSQAEGLCKAENRFPRSAVGKQQLRDREEFLHVVRDCIAVGHNLLLARHCSKLPRYLVDGSSRPDAEGLAPVYIDLWVLDGEGSSGEGDQALPGEQKERSASVGLAVLLSWVLRSCRGERSGWSRYARLRVCALAATRAGIAARKARIRELLYNSRVQFDAMRVVCPEDLKSSNVSGDGGDAKKSSRPGAEDSKAGSGWVRRINAAIRSDMDRTAIAIVPVAAFRRGEKRQASSHSSPHEADQRALVDIGALTQGTCAVLLCQARESPIVSDV